ncbi:MAG: hypothetical protein ABR567_09380 [Myxococcales bacterium]|nr:hypothetical protein [Myxococcales bacterium]
MNRFIPVLAAVLAMACGGSSNPARPAIGATQIDRMGRAGVNTALTDPFGVIPGITSDEAKDQYNAATDPAQWASKFKARIATHLAIYDFVSQCQGKQLAAGSTVAAGRYDALAGVLADDQLYVRTSSSTCGLYLAAEADATGLTTNNGDCGGRTPTEDTIKETFSLLFLGKPTGITDGLPVGASGLGTDDDGNGVNATTFPFLGAPN